MTEDPIKDGLNWYTYCGNNPLMYVDPFGLEYNTIDFFANELKKLYGNNNVTIMNPKVGAKNEVTVTIKDSYGKVHVGIIDRDKMMQSEGKSLIQRENFYTKLGLPFQHYTTDEKNISNVTKGEGIAKSLATDIGGTLILTYFGIPDVTIQGKFAKYAGPAVIDHVAGEMQAGLYLPEGEYICESYYISNYNPGTNGVYYIYSKTIYKKEYEKETNKSIWVYYKT